VGTLHYGYEVDAVLVDMNVMLAQPTRLLLAGVFDALAKFVEIKQRFHPDSEDAYPMGLDYAYVLAERTFRICKVSTRRGIGDKHEANYSAVVKYNGEELTVKLDGEDAPVEYEECTAEYIINPSFEDDKRTLTKVAPSGWRVESPTTWWGVNLGQGNGDPQATEGRYIFGVWDSGNHITAQISQTISNLPKGLYELTVDMHASSQGDLIRLGNQRLFANGQVARFRDQLYITGDGDNYPMQTLTLRFEQAEDNAAVKIGVATDGAPAHTWFKIDNFRLYQVKK
jgi:hypothetical protein